MPVLSEALRVLLGGGRARHQTAQASLDGNRGRTQKATQAEGGADVRPSSALARGLAARLTWRSRSVYELGMQKMARFEPLGPRVPVETPGASTTPPASRLPPTPAPFGEGCAK